MSRIVRAASSLVAGVVLAAGCAGRPPVVPHVAAAASPSALPDAVQVVCDTKGTTVLTPVVRPQRDGVHLQIENTTGKHLSFVVGQLGGDNAPAGSSEIIWPLPPGSAKIGCLDDSVDGGTAPDGEVTVQDPDAIWVDPGVGCDSVAGGVGDYGGGAVGQRGDPVDLARARFGDRLRDGDVVEAAGYPEATDRHVIVVRDGSTVADITYFPDQAGTGWLEDTESTCADFGG